MGDISPAFNTYRSFHYWMMLPFVVSVLGFSYSYYLNLSNATFHQHIHGISATLWYILVMVQPYLIVRKQNVQKHRKLGVFAIMLAGIVAGSSLAMIPKNIDNVESLDVNGFFNPTFAYFATFIDLILIGMFLVSVICSIQAIKQKRLSDHVQWLVASIFFVLSPALLRMLGFGAILLNEGSMEGITMVGLAFPTMLVMLLLITVYYYKFGSFKHLSFTLLVASHLLFLSIEWLGNNESFRNIVTIIFKA